MERCRGIGREDAGKLNKRKETELKKKSFGLSLPGIVASLQRVLARDEGNIFIHLYMHIKCCIISSLGTGRETDGIYIYSRPLAEDFYQQPFMPDEP